MKDSIIKNIYLDYQQSNEFFEDDKKMSSAEYEQAYKKFVGDDLSESIFNSAISESEMKGFMHGFKCAMKITAECGIKGVN